MRRFLISLMLVLSMSNAFAAAPSSDIHRILTSQKGWLNTERALGPEDLRGRIILIDFWTFCCINCIHIMPDLKYLEEKFGNKLTVIGVHSAKFANERDSENIRSAILRYGLEHPVVNDFDFGIWQRFGVRSWPTLILVGPMGTIAQVYSGEGHRDELEADIQALIGKYSDRLNDTPLPIALEKNKTPESVLSFPGKLDYAPDKERLFVSDSGHHRILALSLKGDILESVGSGVEGYKDGDFETAQFRRPQGILYRDNKLYVADTENHALRLIDFATKQVTTIAGTGTQGYERGAKNAPALKIPLASPWDLAFYPDDRHIATAMAGTHQLWSYDVGKQTVSVIAGNGRESIDDGKYPFNSLSQPSGLAAYGDKLYFVDSETSSLRVLENGEITTLIGTGLFDFGFKDGKQGAALMQHSLGLTADKDGVTIADSYNHAIRRYDLTSGMLTTLAGDGKRGALNEPNDVLYIGDKLYITDTNNNALKIWEQGKLSSFAVMPSKAPLTLSEDLPNLEKLPAATIAADKPVTIALGLQKGWKINNDAPSYLAVFKAGEKQPVATLELAALKSSPKLAALGPGQYRLQGTLYYCEDKDGALCLIKSVDGMITAGSGAAAINIPVN